MTRFILNDKEIATSLPRATALLDFIRYDQHLTGTKIGCREGDCGACTVLVGSLKEGKLEYRSMTSCLLPLANVHNKHVVTIEGLNMGELNFIQQAMSDEGATQCGFCTPGFVVSLAGFCLGNCEATRANAIESIDGNICRCTGYKSIERACGKVADLVKQRGKSRPEEYAVAKKIVPAYFSDISTRLSKLEKSNGILPQEDESTLTIVGGGTDLYVQKHDEIRNSKNTFLFNQSGFNRIEKDGNRITLGPSVTVTDLRNSSVIQGIFPNFSEYTWLVSSTPIRNMATIAGNFVNASPIGDFTIFFLALNALLTLSDGQQKRIVPLRKFYKGYKQIDKAPAEYIESIAFDAPPVNSKFNFEKVSKRTNLDIATVNTAINILAKDDEITQVAISAGGVGPVPLHLEKTSAYLSGKRLSEECIIEATGIAQTEISPISDARGTEEYKRLLLSQLIKAHFLHLFPALKPDELFAR